MVLKPSPNPITINRSCWLPLLTLSFSYFPQFVPFSKFLCWQASRLSYLSPQLTGAPPAILSLHHFPCS